LAFLSNMYEVPVLWNGRWWPTSEHAYVGAKFLQPELQDRVAALPSPRDAKRFGRQHPVRPDWLRVRVPLMHGIVTDKFTRYSGLRKQLLATSPELLVDQNTWGDTFWGVCNGVGANWLGRILAEVQQQLLRVVHCKQAPYDVFVGRPGPFGNPFSHLERSSAPNHVASRDEAVDQFRAWALGQPELRARIGKELPHQRLGCYCAPARCHGDVLAWLASASVFPYPGKGVHAQEA
jgi:ribA/ribD-fused uncharacterized protein